MKIRVRKEHLTFGTVSLLGLTLIVGLCYFLSPDVRAGWVRVLEVARADDSLAALLEDEDKDVRAAAGDALVRRGGAAAQSLGRRLGRPASSERGAAARALGRIGTPATGAMPALKRCLRDDPDPGVRRQAALAFALVGRGDPDTVPELVRLLEAHEDDDRAAAAFACRMLGAAAKSAIPSLIDAMRDTDPEVREEAAKALYAVTSGLEGEDAVVRDRGRAALTQAWHEMAAGRPRQTP